MPTVKLPPLVYWRDGRPRFIPDAAVRTLGFKGEDLRHDPVDPRGRKLGPWYTFEEAKAWGLKINEHIAAARQAGKRKAAVEAAERSAAKGTIHELLEEWIAAFTKLVEHGAKKPSTLKFYKGQVKAIRYKLQSVEDRKAGRLVPELFARMPVKQVGLPEFKAFCQYHIDSRGLSMGRATRATLQAAWSWGMTETRWRLHTLDFRKLRLATPKGRVVFYSDAEIRELLAAARALPARTLKDGTVLYRRSIATCLLLALFTGQRQGDRLAFEDSGLKDGRRQFRQSKTGAIVAIPETPQLKAELEANAAHVAAIKLIYGTRSSNLILDETTGCEYKGDTYRHIWQDVRAIAAAKLPSLADKWEMDFRDTAVTWLARAGCSVFEIAAITGHSLVSIHSILKHYLALTPEFADSGIAKLVEWMHKNGMRV